jgi:hypothetical protein
MHPDYFEVLHVAGIDLIQWAVMPRFISAVVRHPVAWILVGTLQSVAGDFMLLGSCDCNRAGKAGHRDAASKPQSSRVTLFHFRSSQTVTLLLRRLLVVAPTLRWRDNIGLVTPSSAFKLNAD